MIHIDSNEPAAPRSQASAEVAFAKLIERCDEAACKLDGMFRDLFSFEERRDLIVLILNTAKETGVEA
jgi:hypothetical protein